MTDFYTRVSGWKMDLEFKPDFEQCIQRVYAWYEGKILDRPPIRFSRHNAEYELKQHAKTWPTLKNCWYDTEYVVSGFISECESKTFHAETFPIFWSNLGPNVFAACHGIEMLFGETTTWINEACHDPDSGVTARPSSTGTASISASWKS